MLFKQLVKSCNRFDTEFPRDQSFCSGPVAGELGQNTEVRA